MPLNEFPETTDELRRDLEAALKPMNTTLADWTRKHKAQLEKLLKAIRNVVESPNQCLEDTNPQVNDWLNTLEPGHFAYVVLGAINVSRNVAVVRRFLEEVTQ